MEFLAHLETEYVMAEIIFTMRKFSTRSNCLYIHVAIKEAVIKSRL